MLIEGLSEDESKMVLDKYKKRYAAVLKSNPDFIKKYPNPDKVIYGMAIKEITKLREKLGKNADVGDYIDDFRKSDAKQFQGKSKKKRDQMAKAAFLNKEEQALEEIDNLMNETGQKISKKNMDDYKRLNELVKAALMGPIKEGMEYDADAMEALGFDLSPGGRYEAFEYATEELGIPVNEILGKLSDDDVYNAIHHSLQIMGMYNMDESKEISEKKKDHDGDGDIDSDDYMIARDKAIKKAKGEKVNEISKRDELKQDLSKGKRDTFDDSTGYLMDLIADFMKDNPSVSPEQVSSQFKRLLDPDEIRGYLETAKKPSLAERILKELRK